jgi:hypothetical protein
MTKLIDIFQFKGLNWYFVKGAWTQGRNSSIQYCERCLSSS